MTHRITPTCSGITATSLAATTSSSERTQDDNRHASRPNVLQLTNTRYLLTNIPELPFIREHHAGEGTRPQRIRRHCLSLSIQRARIPTPG